MSLLEALAEYLDPPEIVIIRETADSGRTGNASSASCMRRIGMVFSIPRTLDGLDACHRRQESRRDVTRAYVCRGSHLLGAGGIACGSRCAPRRRGCKPRRLARLRRARLLFFAGLRRRRLAAASRP